MKPCLQFNLSQLIMLGLSTLVCFSTLASTSELAKQRGRIKSQTAIDFRAQMPHQPQAIGQSQFDTEMASYTFSWQGTEINAFALDYAKALKPQYQAAAQSYFQRASEKHGASKWSIDQSPLTALHDTGRGGIVAQFSQKVDGIEVIARRISVLINRQNELVATSGYFSPASSVRRKEWLVSPQKALAIAFAENRLSLAESRPLRQQAEKAADRLTTSDVILVKKQSSSDFQWLEYPLARQQIMLTSASRVKQIWFPTEQDQLIPAYYVEAETIDVGSDDAASRTSTLFSYVVDAFTGEVHVKHNLTAHVAATYRVFADYSGQFFPYDGPQGIGLTPHPSGDVVDTPPVGESFVATNSVTLDHAGLSTQDPWLTVAETTTSGNNVDAYADISGEDGFDDQDIRPTMTSPNAFEYSFASFSDGLRGDGQKHAVVNLFYVNNFLHDWFYDNGFDESAGNAQRDNFGRGGIDSDPLKVEAQDFSGFNNANMSTPADGGSPRMQMFVFNILSESGLIVSGVDNIETATALFGPDEFDQTGTLSLVDDGTAPNGDGCETLPASLIGKVALIDRGNCNFTVKVKNAQIAGARAVIIANHIAAGNVGGGVLVMGGSDDSITIPSLFISLESGAAVKAAMDGNSALAARVFNVNLPLDSTLDNAVVAHEWSHFMTNRLIGDGNGLRNNQGKSLGEGWSDFVALLFTVKESDSLQSGNELFQGVYAASTFVGNAYYGRRRVPYSTDRNKNALSFRHIENGVSLPLNHPVAFGVSGASNAQVHNAGEVWATVLWDSFVALVNKPGNTFEQARETMKDYLVASLKMTPVDPTFVEARDALLAVALASDSEDFKLLRDAFSQRGMGAGAIAPLRLSEDHRGVVEDFTTGIDLQASLVSSASAVGALDCDFDQVVDQGESAQLRLDFKNYAPTGLPAFNVSLSAVGDLAFSDDVLNIAPLSQFGEITSVNFEAILNSASFFEAVNINARVEQIGAAPDDFVEPAEQSLQIFTHFDFMPSRYDDDMSVGLTSQHDWQAIQNNESLIGFTIEDGAWHGPDNGVNGAIDLVSPKIRVAATGEFSVDFEHFFFFESSDNQDDIFTHWDGGVIEISIDGEGWQDVVTAGATLSEPYNGQIDTSNSVIGSRAAYVFTRDPQNAIVQLQANRISFAEGLVNGHNIRLRFRIGSDARTGDFGWLIDNVVVNNAIDPPFSDIVAEDNICLSASRPLVDAGEDIVIVPGDNNDILIELSGQATDADGDSLTYQWSQRAGSTVNLTNSNTANAQFSLAAPQQDQKLIFELIVSDGDYQASDIKTVTIRLNRAPTVSLADVVAVEGERVTLIATANDEEGDPLDFVWRQLAGPTVNFTDNGTAMIEFTAPQVDSLTELMFEVQALDGRLTSLPATAKVTINNSVSRKSGGGGMTGWALLLLIGLSQIGNLCGHRRTNQRNSPS